MAYITGFKVTGLVGRKDTYKCELNRDVNVFFGLNGSGKTSLIRILDSALGNDSDSIAQVPFYSAEVTFYSEKFGRRYVRRIERTEMPIPTPRARRLREQEVSYDETVVSESESAPDQKFSWNTTPPLPKSATGGFRRIYMPAWRSFTGSYLPSPQVGLSYLSRISEEREGEWDIIFAERLEQLWTRYSNEVLSRIRSVQTEGLTNILRGVLTGKPSPRKNKRRIRVSDADEAYEKVGAFLQRQNVSDILGQKSKFVRRFSQDLQFRRMVGDIESVESQVEEASLPRQHLENLISRMFSGRKSVVFTDTSIRVETDDGVQIGLASLSSGEKQVLRLFIDTLRAEESPLLIDEPEISLHVDWQKELISDMQELNPETQLIFATHSPEILSDLPDSKIFEL